MKQIFYIEKLLFYSLILLLPTQLGLHFWPDFASVLGIRVDYLSPTIYVTDILIGLLFAVWLIKKWSNGQMVKWSKITIKPYSHLAIQVVFVISYLLLVISLSGRIIGGLYSWLKFVEMSFLAYYSAKFIIDKKQFKNIIFLFSIATIFEGTLAIAQFIKHESIGGPLYFLGERTFDGSTPGIANASLNGELVLRPYGTFPHPNVLAGFLLITMILILFSISNKDQVKIKVFKFVSLLVGSIALILSMSRVAILLWIAIAGFYFLAKIKKRGALVLVGVVVIFILSPIGSRFTNINTTDEAITQRNILIESSIKMISQKPLLGVGLGNFLPTLATIQKPQYTSTYLQPVHNTFLLAAAETGLIGLGFFLWFLWKTFQRIMKQEERIKETLILCFSAILILGLFDHYWFTLQQGQLLFAFVVGLSWRLVDD